jgi:sugar phosphate isomerase/epimerase
MTDPQNLAVQMYSLRELTLPLDDTLREVKAAGYSGIETVGTQGVSADELRALLEKYGLRVVSSHVGLESLEADPDGVIAFNRAVGNDTLIVPGSPRTHVRLQQPVGKLWAHASARSAKVCERDGLRLMYHNHDFEMQLIGGKTALEHLLAGAGESLGLELDLAWVVRGAGTPWRCWNLSGPGGARSRQGHRPRRTEEDEDGWADVGSGTLPWEGLLSAAQAAGTEWFVVEHDKPKDPLASIRISAAYLKGRLYGLRPAQTAFGSPGVPGREEAIRDLLSARARGRRRQPSRPTQLGNLIAVKKSKKKKGKRVMVSAHMDEIGFYVRFIDDGGFFAPSEPGRVRYP